MIDSVLEKFKSIKESKDSSGTPLYETMRKNLEEMILNGEIPDNYRLPSDKELASFIGVNHVTLVKSLNQLRNQGLIVRSRAKGTFIKAPEDGGEFSPGEKNKLVAVIFDDINPETFQSELFISLHDGLQENGLEMLFLSSSGKANIQFEQIKSILQKPNCCGCMVWSIMLERQVAQLMSIKPVDFPLVFMDKCESGIDCSYHDSVAGAKKLAQIIMRKKYYKIVFLSHSKFPKVKHCSNRFLALREAFAENDIDPENVIMYSPDDNKPFNLDHLIKVSSNAIVVSSRPAEALKLKQQLDNAGYSLPGLFPLISFGPAIVGKTLKDADISEMRYYPSILGKNAVNILVARLNGDRGGWKRASTDAEFIERTSSRKVKSKVAAMSV
jgi:DNA-binding LacI/PurR family transcriptional regulator/biotin operon repressor